MEFNFNKTEKVDLINSDENFWKFRLKTTNPELIKQVELDLNDYFDDVKIYNYRQITNEYYDFFVAKNLVPKKYQNLTKILGLIYHEKINFFKALIW
ncbi:hypothetical protein ACW95P_01450 [Candidatus Mycoplasma pogonae]